MHTNLSVLDSSGTTLQRSLWGSFLVEVVQVRNKEKGVSFVERLSLSLGEGRGVLSFGARLRVQQISSSSQVEFPIICQDSLYIQVRSLDLQSGHIFKPGHPGH